MVAEPGGSSDERGFSFVLFAVVVVLRKGLGAASPGAAQNSLVKLFTVSAAGLPRRFSNPEQRVRCREQNSTRAGSSSPIPFALEVGGKARVELFFT